MSPLILSLRLIRLSSADGCDQAVKTFASCLKNSRIQKLELIECAELSPIHIATICKDLHDNEILEELIITSTKVPTIYFYFEYFVF